MNVFETRRTGSSPVAVLGTDCDHTVVLHVSAHASRILLGQERSRESGRSYSALNLVSVKERRVLEV